MEEKSLNSYRWCVKITRCDFLAASRGKGASLMVAAGFRGRETHLPGAPRKAVASDRRIEATLRLLLLTPSGETVISF
jgi:hypothetical protein